MHRIDPIKNIAERNIGDDKFNLSIGYGASRVLSQIRAEERVSRTDCVISGNSEWISFRGGFRAERERERRSRVLGSEEIGSRCGGIIAAGGDRKVDFVDCSCKRLF